MKKNHHKHEVMGPHWKNENGPWWWASAKHALCARRPPLFSRQFDSSFPAAGDSLAAGRSSPSPPPLLPPLRSPTSQSSPLWLSRPVEDRKVLPLADGDGGAGVALPTFRGCSGVPLWRRGHFVDPHGEFHVPQQPEDWVWRPCQLHHRAEWKWVLCCCSVLVVFLGFLIH